MEIGQAEGLACEKCGSEKVKVIKRGFSTKAAVLGFLAVCLIMACAWYAVYVQVDYLSITYSSFYVLLQIATILLPIFGFLFGTVDANKRQIMCLTCDHRKLI